MGEVNELIEMSRRVGSDARLVQAGGGNTSIKSDNDEYMYVKASGTALAEMKEGRGYRKLELARALAALKDDALARLEPVARDEELGKRINAACADDLPGNPSVETPLHAFLGRCVIHIHPTATNGMLCANDGRAALEELLADISPSPLYIPWTEPGLSLARETYRAVKDYERRNGLMPKLLLLQNHGIFISDDSADAARELAVEVEERANGLYRKARESSGKDRVEFPEPDADGIDQVAGIIKDVWAEWMPGQNLAVEAATRGIAMEMACNPKSPELLAVGALTPDQLAYAHGAPIWLEADAGADEMERGLAECLAKQMEHRSSPPRSVLAKNLGLLVVETSQRLAGMVSDVMISALEILDITSYFGGPRPIPEEAAAFIEGWVYEEHRRKVAENGI